MLRLALVIVLFAACAEAAPPRALDELVIRDSLYLDPETLTPYTGSVFRMFADDLEKQQIRGELANGVWSGEMVVYHQNGRIRYMGSFVGGERCGAWTENRDAAPPADIFAELRQEVESMGLYRECSS